VPLLERFSAPAGLTELGDAGLAAWSQRVAGMVESERTDAHPQFFDPLADGDGTEPPPATAHEVVWPAFPGTLVDPGGSDPQRWQEADSDRDRQDEYCEWGVERSGDEIARVTFTTETPDYFEQLLGSDPDLFLDLYEELVGARPTLEQLQDDDGKFDWANGFNRSPSGAIAHLSQGSNNLFAAVALIAQATVLREKEGVRITDKKVLCRCNGLGVAERNSDPLIAIAVNQLAAAGEEVAVADPPGLYIHEFLDAGIRTPDETPAADFWQVTRGDAGHALRAMFEVPPDRGYSVSDLEVDGRRVEFGGQLADRVRVRVVALSRPSAHAPEPQPCRERS
jgi:hypothetical protein